MAEPLNLNDYNKVNRVPGQPGVLEGVPKDGSDTVTFNEDMVLKAMKHTKKERRDYNKDFLSKDSWPDEEPTEKHIEVELETEGYPKEAMWHSNHDGDQKARIEGKVKDQDAYLIVTENEVNGTRSHEVPFSELTLAPESEQERKVKINDKIIQRDTGTIYEVRSIEDKGKGNKVLLHEVGGSNSTIYLPEDDLNKKLSEEGGAWAWAEDNAETPKSDLDKLREELEAKFETRFKEMEDRFAAREKELTDEIERLKKELAEAKGEAPPADANEDIDSDVEALKKEFPPMTVLKFKTKKGEMKDAKVVGYEKDDDGTQKIQLTNIHGDNIWATPAELREWNGMTQPNDDSPLGGDKNKDPATGEFNPDDYEWDPFPGEECYVKVGDEYEPGWEIAKVFKNSENVLMITAQKDGKQVTKPYEVFLMWQVEAGAVIDEDEDDTPEKPVEVLDDTSEKPRWWKRIFNRSKRYTPTGIVAYWQSRGARTIITEEEEVRGRRGFGVGALALVGVLGVGAGYAIDLVEDYFEAKHGVPKAHVGNTLKHVNLHGIDPNTIHAHTPNEFQHGVINLLAEQHVHATHPMTHAQIEHMNSWMQQHGIASGMKDGTHGLEQNVVNFPGGNHEFANANMPGSDQGFTLGKSGTGRESLDRWVREAERIGVRFNRTS